MNKEEVLYTALHDACDDLVSMQNDTKYIPHYMQKYNSVDECVQSYYNDAEEYLKSHNTEDFR